ncbi:hypothetical protein SAMN05216184_11744 [Georgenia satyanarayanai]|uniref:Uncharacterized protein n=1 Tax=Georgenia satyanarayanai TaxID=860221 RepID=A0A2Y9C0M3_9MICO|nr:hypothetical protein A8987_11744 [Georgenia satyanarayanai]SSA46422.1 hypothetical protein SAMN05216184_11744 [Georgenia satyanarayanai]
MGFGSWEGPGPPRSTSPPGARSVVAVRTTSASTGVWWRGRQASTVVISGASVTGTATWSGHCHARLEPGMTSRVLPSATSCEICDWERTSGPGPGG